MELDTAEFKLPPRIRLKVGLSRNCPYVMFLPCMRCVIEGRRERRQKAAACDVSAAGRVGDACSDQHAAPQTTSVVATGATAVSSCFDMLH